MSKLLKPILFCFHIVNSRIKRWRKAGIKSRIRGRETGCEETARSQVETGKTN